jgi:hypothetical protein
LQNPRRKNPEQSNLENEGVKYGRTLLCVMFLGESSSNQMVYHPTSPVAFVLFWRGIFLIFGYEEWGPFSGPSFSITDYSGFFWC